MRVLLVHSRYQIRGGEDECFDAEQRLLREAGIEVGTFTDDNRRAGEMGALEAARTTIWSTEAYRALRERIRKGRHDIVHVHNTLPLISPAAYHAAQAEGAAVVQTLHNYRLMCPNGLFYRDSHVCEDCLGKWVPWPAVAHACYRDSRPASAAVAAMLATHRALGTYRSKVDLYIALNEFMRQKHIEGGIPAERIAIKPNFIPADPGMGTGDGGYALFTARLTEEKGVGTLLAAWERLGARIPIRIMGDGPMSDVVREAAARIPGVTYLGRQPIDEFYRLLGGCSFFIFTSTWYEGFPRTIIESYGRGVPIVASAIGPIAEVVVKGETGLHFTPGDVDDLVAKVGWLLDHPDTREHMRHAARREFESKFTAEANREQIVRLYERAIAERRARTGKD
jgi:glycosyltransferase involved in cell wall biosynthesis